MSRKKRAQRFPWYDSRWLRTFFECQQWIAARHPEQHKAFLKAFRPLQVRPDFETVVLRGVLTPDDLEEILALDLRNIVGESGSHEVESNGRLLVHDHPVFTRIQKNLTNLVRDQLNETVEPFFNFIGMYLDNADLDIHLDSPHSKWTLDVCIRQTSPWPIHISRVVPWPLQIDCRTKGWKNRLKQDPELEFTEYVLEPGDGVLFSGSSQWHYRPPPRVVDDAPGDFLFMHFINSEGKELVEPTNWAGYFDLPELERLVTKFYV